MVRVLLIQFQLLDRLSFQRFAGLRASGQIPDRTTIWTNRDILAEKGYVDGEREERLTKQGWRMHIQRKGTKDNPISEAQQRRNDPIVKTRARVEHVFDGLAQLGGKVVRSVGLPRATLQLNWKVAVYNLQRLVYLKEAGVLRSAVF